VTQSHNAPWHQTLRSAIKRNRADAQSRYLQLASVDSDGWPRNRTVVFRGFDVDEEALLVVTDSRSAKLAEFQHESRGEACWYFSRTREQFRIAVRVSVLTADNDANGRRSEIWSTLSEAAQAQFYWPTPGIPWSDPSAQPMNNSGEVAEYFSVLCLVPERVDHLTLGKTHHRIFSERREEGWCSWVVNP